MKTFLILLASTLAALAQMTDFNPPRIPVSSNDLVVVNFKYRQYQDAFVPVTTNTFSYETNGGVIITYSTYTTNVLMNKPQWCGNLVSNWWVFQLPEWRLEQARANTAREDLRAFLEAYRESENDAKKSNALWQAMQVLK